MEVKKTETLLYGQKARIQAEITYDDCTKKDVIWFEFDKKFVPLLTSSANTWLVCLAPFAFSLGQPLIINQQVDETLLENIKESIRLLNNFAPLKKIIPIEADSYIPDWDFKSSKTAAFFTGGVDSFYTVIKNDTGFKNHKIDCLITVLGIEVPQSNSYLFPEITSRFLSIADKLKKELIVINTNLMETRYRKMSWLSYYSYGLAGAALALEKHYKNVLLSSGVTNKERKFNLTGAHPDIIPFLKSSRISFILDSAGVSRIEKINLISGHGVALDNLKVCSKSKTGTNCCKCEKCLRTMLPLYLFKKLNNCAAFRQDNFSIKNISRIYFKKNDHKIIFWKELEEYAEKINRLDVVSAIHKSFTKSRLINIFLPLIKKIKNKFSFRIGFFLEKLLMRKSI